MRLSKSKKIKGKKKKLKKQINSIFFFELVGDLYFLKKKLLIDKTLIVISTNPITSRELIKNQIEFIDIESFYDFKMNYLGHVKKTLSITKLIEKDFYSTYLNFNQFKWNIYDDFIYSIKICYDQLFYYTICLNKIFKTYRVSKVYVSENKKIEFSKMFLFNKNQSILFNLLKLKKKINIKSIDSNQETENYKPDKFSFGLLKNKIKFKWVEHFLLKNKLKKTYGNIISVSSHEVHYMLSKYPGYKKNITNLEYPMDVVDTDVIKEDNYKLINKLKKNKKLRKTFMINNFDTSEIFFLQLSNISLAFDSIYKKFLYFLNIINRQNTKLIIFNDLTGHNHLSIVLNKICDLKKIPKVVWCHGGYCNLKLDGYDVTDFKFSQNHFSYGSYLKKIVSDINFLPNKIYKKKYNTYEIGSPFINIKFQNKNKIKNLKKKIIFIRGDTTNYNQFYFPDSRGDKMSSQVKFHHKILDTLKEYQYDYEIIFKDYPNSEEKNYWINYLIDEGMKNIKYISETSLHNVLDDNQLVILPWISTTFFQSLPYRNQIFIHDKNLYTKPFTKCADEIKYFTREEFFFRSLRSYLSKMNKINFKYNNKTMKHFLNGNSPQNYKKSFDLAIKNIVKISSNDKEIN